MAPSQFGERRSGLSGLGKRIFARDIGHYVEYAIAERDEMLPLEFHVRCRHRPKLLLCVDLLSRGSGGGTEEAIRR